MPFFQEYEVVQLSKTVAEADLAVGTVGTILIIHQQDTAVYEVEFVSATGDHLALLTVQEDCLVKANP